MDIPILIYEIIVLVFSAVVHEVSHGFMAERLGDPTARLAGRLTLNPLKHLDPFGSVLLPLLMLLSGTGIVFGWAKPVPYNPYQLKDPAKGGALIAAAGPASNLAIAAVFALFFRVLAAATGPVPGSAAALLLLTGLIVQVNLMLAIFNLVPIPPLDGSKILIAFLPASAGRAFGSIERYGFLLVLLFIFFGFSIIAPVIGALFHLLTGA